jgi:hypothetical protein
VGLCPLPHVDAFQMMIPLLPDEQPELTEAAAVSLFHARTGRTDLKLHDLRWLSIFTPSLRLADAYRVGRVFIAGDAAHVHPPTGAQGLNTSVQDAYNLGWKLALVLEGLADETLLDTYEAERRPVGAGILGLSLSIARQEGIAVQPRGRQTQQLDLNYRDSRLSVDRGAAERPLVAGDRAPDAPYADALGQPARLFEAFRGPHFTLLLFAGAEVDLPADGPTTVAVRLPAHGPAAKTYGVTGPTAVLVRPDNYLGLYAVDPGRHAVTDYLQQILTPARRPAPA